MIGPAEIEALLAEYAEALAAGSPDAIRSEPVWPVPAYPSAGPADPPDQAAHHPPLGLQAG